MIYAIDCDLRSLSMAAEDGTVIVSRGSWGAILAALAPIVMGPHIVLFEIAGPAYARTDSRAAMHATQRWAIYNAAKAGQLAAILRVPQLLVATSAVWTQGFNVKVRHKLAGLTGHNKDVRECLCMIWMYKNSPLVWEPLVTYLERDL